MPLHELRNRGFAFPFEHAVDRSPGMLEQVARHERGAVSAEEDEHPRMPRSRGLCQVNQLRNIGQIVAGECHDIGAPLVDLAEVVDMVIDLKIKQANLMPRSPQLGADELDAQRLKRQENLRVQERAGVNSQYFHG